MCQLVPESGYRLGLAWVPVYQWVLASVSQSDSV